MSSLQIRPRFKIRMKDNKEVILERIAKALGSEAEEVTGKIVTHHIVLNIIESKQHYWSPQLHLEIEEDQDGSLIRGLFGPKPTVWTLFVFLYAVIGLFGLIALTFGLSEWMLGEESLWIWGIPISILLAAIIYLMARVGQRLGADQMHILREFLDQAIRD